MRRRAGRVGLPVLLILAATGCSLAFVKGPPAGHEEMTEFTCTEKLGGPIFEGAWGVLFLGLELGMDGGYGSGVALILGGFWTADAAVGFWKVDRCRAALEELRQRTPPTGEDSESRSGPDPHDVASR